MKRYLPEVCRILLVSVQFLVGAHGELPKHNPLDQNRPAIESSCSVVQTEAVLSSGRRVSGEGSYRGALTPFWAQEMVGADLAVQAMRDLKLHRSSIAIVDSGFRREGMDPTRFSKEFRASLEKRDFPWTEKQFRASGPDSSAFTEHGTHVSNLIFQPPPVGVSAGAEIALLVDRGMFSGSSESTDSALDDLISARETQGEPRAALLANVSMSLAESNATRSKLDRLEKLGVILVLAAGNDYPVPPPGLSSHEALLTVGSLSA